MAHNRAQLNDLIFHNRVVLPLTSPGYAEMTLAVAELQGGNHAKAALYAEAAVMRDPTLAAGWLAKMSADVFEAAPSDLRTERAAFCLERAMERAPACQREMIDFFVANILRHYVSVLCRGAIAEADRWSELESAAARARNEAAVLAAMGLVTALTAIFSRSLPVKLASGLASAAAFSASAGRDRDADLLKLMGTGHRTASLLHVVPTRDLIWLGVQLLRAADLPTRILEPSINEFVETFRLVVETHLKWLCREMHFPISLALHGSKQSLILSYLGLPSTTRFSSDHAHLAEGPMEHMHPASQGLLTCLEQVLPSVKTTLAYRLLGYPMLTIKQTSSGTINPWKRSARRRPLRELLPFRLWLVDTWLQQPLADLLRGRESVIKPGEQAPPSLALAGGQKGQPVVTDPNRGFYGCMSVVLLIGLLLYAASHAPDAPSEKRSKETVSPAPPQRGADAESARREVRRATAVTNSGRPTSQPWVQRLTRILGRGPMPWSALRVGTPSTSVMVRG